MRKVILKELLDRYERSRLFREGASSKRILLDVSSCAAFEGISENADRKTAFLSALEGLKQEGLVDYSWVRFERGNLVDKIWLITDPESLKKSYQLLGRMPRAEKVQVLEEQLGAFVAEPNEDAITDELLSPKELRENLVGLGLQAVELSEEEFYLAEEYNAKYTKPSLYDCVALAIAKVRGITLMSGDGPLRKAAEQEGVSVIGTIGILDQLYEGSHIIKEDYINCMRSLQENNGKKVRLPEEELQKRIQIT